MIIGQFEYIDNIEARYQASLPPNLTIHNASLEELLVARLLLGTLKVKNQTTNQIIIQKLNFGVHDYSLNNKISTKPIRDFLDVDLTLNDFDDYIAKAIRYGNKKLFRNLLLEITHYFFCKQNRNELNAFLHLYRALELISFCFPLYYASQSTNYHGTFDTLKKYFKESDSERTFFKNFVHSHLFRADNLLDIRLPISFDSSNPTLQKQYYQSFFKIKNQNNRDIEVIDSTEYSEVVINRRSLISLMISLRNRNFHLLEGDYNDNLKAEDLYDFNGFYKNFNDVFLNWISLIYFRILRKAIENR